MYFVKQIVAGQTDRQTAPAQLLVKLNKISPW